MKDCRFVFVRDDTVRKSLRRPYQGPFEVLDRSPKHYLIQFPNRQARILICRLKPAYTLNEGTDYNYTPTLLDPVILTSTTNTTKNKTLTKTLLRRRQLSNTSLEVVEP